MGRGLELLTVLAESMAEVSDPQYRMENNLHAGHPETIRHLVKLGADIDCNNGQPLYDAIRMRRVDAIKEFVALGATILPRHRALARDNGMEIYLRRSRF